MPREPELILESDSDGEWPSENSESEPEDELASSDNEWICRPPVVDIVKPCNFTGKQPGFNKDAAPTIKPGSTPTTIFLLFFSKIISQLKQETNRYYHQYSVKMNVKSPKPDVTSDEIISFLALIIQMAHCMRDETFNYWSRLEQFYTPFYGQVIARDRFMHILRFIHFCNNETAPNKTDETYDRLWKIRIIFESLNDSFAKYYHPAEVLSIDELRSLIKGRVLPNKERVGTKLYVLCDSTGYICNMTVFMEKVTPHAIVKNLTKRVEGVGHKLYMNHFFSSPDLFDSLRQKNIFSCGTVRTYRKNMPRWFDDRLKLKRGDIQVRLRNNLTAIAWKDRHAAFLLTNFHTPPVQGNFCDKYGNAVQPTAFHDYRSNIGYVKKADNLINDNMFSRRTWKWSKKLFVHLVNVAILNSYIISKSLGYKKSHRLFRLNLVRGLLVLCKAKKPSVRNDDPHTYPPTDPLAAVVRLEACKFNHWPVRGETRIRCRVCSKRNIQRRSYYSCKECNVGLCVDGCFEIYHTKNEF